MASAVEIEEGVTLLEMLEREDEPLRHVIVERNGPFVHPSAYHAVLLAEGDVIEAWPARSANVSRLSVPRRAIVLRPFMPRLARKP
jgi:thiamine biosynthesis protein ThiS